MPSDVSKTTSDFAKIRLKLHDLFINWYVNGSKTYREMGIDIYELGYNILLRTR